MKKILSTIYTAIILFFCLGLNSCVKDTCKKTTSYTILKPVYKNWDEVKLDIKSSTPKPIAHPGKLYIKGNYIFLNEIDKGVHIIDNRNPASPVNVAFINIPGNVDIAVKDDVLYADIYTRLLAINIANPLQSVVTKITESVFPNRVYNNGFYVDSTKIIVDWLKKDTVVSEDCTNPIAWGNNFLFSAMADTKSYNGASISVPGISGSLSRFTVTNNRLYTIDFGELKVFNVDVANNPVQVNSLPASNWNSETIFPFKDKLFIGSQNGISIFNISNPNVPTYEGGFAHARICDPVIADDNYAYVTLWSESRCVGILNQLDVLDITNINQPRLVKSYPLKSPHGLSKDGDLLFICDGIAGVKIYNATNVQNLQLVNQINNVNAFEVIAYNKNAIVVAEDGLYQYDYSNASNIKLLSKIITAK
jgi:hypothetical protein